MFYALPDPIYKSQVLHIDSNDKSSQTVIYTVTWYPGDHCQATPATAGPV